MSNLNVDVSSFVRHGKFRVSKTNKNLDRPRAVREQVLTTCVSLGQSDGSGNGGKGMQFSSKRPEDVFGVKR